MIQMVTVTANFVGTVVGEFVQIAIEEDRRKNKLLSGQVIDDFLVDRDIL